MIESESTEHQRERSAVILNVHIREQYEIAQFRWDSASELVRGERPGIHRMVDQTMMDHRKELVKENNPIARVHRVELREVADLRWDGAIELIVVEPPVRATMKSKFD